MPFSSTHEDNVSQKNKGQDGETFLIQRLLGFTQNRAIEVCGPLRNGMARLLSWFQNGDLHSQVQDWCFKKQFSGPSLWNLKTHWKVSFYVFFFDDRVEKRNCEIFFRTKFSFAFKSVHNIFGKKGNRFIRLWTIPGLFYSAQLVKHFSFFFITDKDYGYLLSWGLGFILWCSSFSEWVFPYTCQLLIGFGKFFPSPVLKKRLYSSLVTHPAAAHSSSRSPYHETTRSMTTPPWMMC